MKDDLAKAQREAQQARAAAQQATQKAATLEQERQEEVKQRQAIFVARDYDAGANKTDLTTRAMPLQPTRGTRAKHWIDLAANYAGKTAGGNTNITLGVQTQYSGSTHRNAKTLSFSADGATVTATRTNYDRLRRVSGSAKNRKDNSDEYLTFTLSAADARTLGKAVKVTGKLGYVEFALPRSTQEGIAAFANAMDRSE
jgi:hypothetical protein